MLKLGLNIDHVATLREARYRGRSTGEPSPLDAALICENAGAHSITAHLREDRRHIQDRDILDLRQHIRTRLNLEMGNLPEIVQIALKIKPDIICLVPERRKEITTEGGLNVASQIKGIGKTCDLMRDHGILVSLFITPDPRQVGAAARVQADFIELHTGAFAESFSCRRNRRIEIQRLKQASLQATELGLRVNAGHGLNYQNVQALAEVPYLEELNIGHSIVSRSITVGLKAAVREMLDCMKFYRKGTTR